MVIWGILIPYLASSLYFLLCEPDRHAQSHSFSTQVIAAELFHVHIHEHITKYVGRQLRSSLHNYEVYYSSVL